MPMPISEGFAAPKFILVAKVGFLTLMGDKYRDLVVCVKLGNMGLELREYPSDSGTWLVPNRNKRETLLTSTREDIFRSGGVFPLFFKIISDADRDEPVPQAPRLAGRGPPVSGPGIPV